MGKRKKVEEKPAPEPVVTVVPEFDPEDLPQPAKRPSMPRIIAPSGEPPVVLGGHDVRSVFRWAEALRDWHQNRGEYLTVHGLLVYGGYMGSNREEVWKHIKDIYCEEYSLEKEYNKQLIRGTAQNVERKAGTVSSNGDHTVTQGNKGGKHYELFNHPITAVLRWMGKNGWSVADARKALDNLGLKDVARATLSAQIAAGKKPDNPRGEPAQLTEEQVSKLNSARA